MKSGPLHFGRKFGQIKQNWGLYLLLFPAVVLTLLFAYKPMYGVLIAFKDYSPALGIGAAHGLDSNTSRNSFIPINFHQRLKTH